MKTNLILLPIAFIAALLVACSQDKPQQLADQTNATISTTIDTNLDKAIAEIKADTSDINVTLKDASKASIAANGDLTIDGKLLTLTAKQREISKRYYRTTKELAMQGVEIGKESVKLASQAIGSAIGGLISGQDQAAIEKTMEGKTANIEVTAMKLCDSAVKLKAIQLELASSVPAFTPEPMQVTSEKDGCQVTSGSDNNISVGDNSPPAPEAPKAPSI